MLRIRDAHGLSKASWPITLPIRTSSWLHVRRLSRLQLSKALSPVWGFGGMAGFGLKKSTLKLGCYLGLLRFWV